MVEEVRCPSSLNEEESWVLAMAMSAARKLQSATQQVSSSEKKRWQYWLGENGPSSEKSSTTIAYDECCHFFRYGLSCSQDESGHHHG